MQGQFEIFPRKGFVKFSFLNDNEIVSWQPYFLSITDSNL